MFLHDADTPNSIGYIWNDVILLVQALENLIPFKGFYFHECEKLYHMAHTRLQHMTAAEYDANLLVLNGIGFYHLQVFSSRRYPGFLRPRYIINTQSYRRPRPIVDV